MSKPATRHARIIIDADAELRRRWTGSRFTVGYREMGDALNIAHGTISPAMLSLSKIAGSGLKRTNRAGTYEYMMPEHYPKELFELKAAMQKSRRTPHRRSGLPSALDRYVGSLEPGTVFDIRDAVVAVEDWGSGSVGRHLRQFAQSGKLECYNRSGTYRKPSLEASKESEQRLAMAVNPPLKDAAIPETTGSTSQVEKDGKGMPKGPTPRTIADAAEKVAQRILEAQKATMLQEIAGATTADGCKIAQHCITGKIYKLVEI